jgi:mannosyltransferase OCH1-like enzyme
VQLIPDVDIKIPKIIHYCWFGHNPLPPLAQKCIASWRAFCPDYQIVEWNETNFDYLSNDYAREAYEAKKWAFVADYARLRCLVKYGGIYMDTDLELLKAIDPFLTDEAFAGFEINSYVSAGILGCSAGQRLFKLLLSIYEKRHFVFSNGAYDMTTIVVLITAICEQLGLMRKNQKQTIQGLTIYPEEYFYPMDYRSRTLNITDKTVANHHFVASWI